MESTVEEGHTEALQQLVLLFDWLDTLEPQPTKDIINLLKKSQEIEDKIGGALDFVSKLVDMENKLKRTNESNDGNVIVRPFAP